MAHMLEERGLATTVIASVLPQVEKTRPPRAMFVPFMLGRPLGEPNDPAFQRRVLLQALGLLERSDGPVILEQFPDDNPGWFDRSLVGLEGDESNGTSRGERSSRAVYVVQPGRTALGSRV